MIIKRETNRNLFLSIKSNMTTFKGLIIIYILNY